MSVRQSNLELMRCVSMLFVLMVHCVFYSNGFPSMEESLDHPFESFYYSLMQSLSVCCVDCFILISGYFGISTTWKKVLNILFIVLFWKVGIYIFFCLIGKVSFDITSLYQNIKLTGFDWFVYAYLGLMFMAPILNAWFDNADKKQVYLYTLIFFSVMALSTIVKVPIIEFNDGYSAVAFCGIYILGRIYRRDIEGKYVLGKNLGLILYLSMAVLGAGWFILGAFILKDFGVRGFPLSYAYCSPIVVFQSLGVLIFFSHLRFQSKFVNSLAVSAFSVYIIHCHNLIHPIYKESAKWIFETCGLWLSLPAFVLFTILVYLAFSTLDRVRVLIFKLVSLRRPLVSSLDKNAI